jgi:hypothetical protein
MANKNIIVKLWSGEVALAKAYWLWGVLANMLLSIVIGIVPLLNQTIVIPLSAFTVVYAVFISVAIWKSATRYEGKVLWKYLAKIAVIIPLILIGISLSYPKLTASTAYQSSSECMFKELKKSDLLNVQLATNNIRNYCNLKVSENLEAQLDGLVDIKKMIAVGVGYQQISEAFFMKMLELKKYPKREGYTKVSECNFDLTKGTVGSKEKELFVDGLAKAYCYEIVAINIGSKVNYDLYGARKEEHSFKEIAEYLELKR